MMLFLEPACLTLFVVALTTLKKIVCHHLNLLYITVSLTGRVVPLPPTRRVLVSDMSWTTEVI